eukprot:TRINITY_DN4531_c0_g1_i1.p1 TRINITY_DN4531_c0_g1~~TRINITY_DN4531_c0_g1_i1.p1  ORF type:complete len:760 (+),score=163.32 TRINITY_DN4531_c0_g1_i1:98-2377(+)
MSTNVAHLDTLSWRELGVISGINVAIGSAILIAFEILRHLKANRYFYAPLYFEGDANGDTKATDTAGNYNISLEPSDEKSTLIPPKNPVPNPFGLFRWIIETIKYNEIELMRTRGLDAVMHLRTLKIMIFILSLFSIVGLGFLIPVNYTATEHYVPGRLDYNSTISEDVGALSMSNIQIGSNLMWAHTLSTIGFTALACYILFREYKRYALLRIQYNKEEQAHNYTVMVKKVPSSIQTSEQLRGHFERIYGDKIVNAHMPLPTNTLRHLLKKRNKTREHLEEVIHINGGDHPVRFGIIKVKSWFLCLSRAHCENPVQRYGDELQVLENQIAEQRKTAGHWPDHHHEKLRMQHQKDEVSVGFVTFGTKGDAFECAQSVQSSDSKILRVQPAPHKKDAFWNSLTRINANTYSFIHMMSLAFFFVLIVFYGALVTILTGISNIDHLRQYSWLGWLVKLITVNAFIQDVFQSYLPFLFIIILQTLVPIIIKIVLKLRGEITRSRLEKSLMRIHFNFLVFNVMIVFVIVNTTTAVVTHIIDYIGKNFSEMVSLLGASLPGQSASFVNYLLVYAFTRIPQLLLRVGPFIKSFFRMRTAATSSEERHCQRPNRPEYGVMYANALLLFLISVTYASISPFIPPFGVLALGMEYFVAKYHHMYTTPQKFTSAAYLWPCVYNRMLAGLAFSHLTILGVFVLKQFYAGIILIAPLPVVMVFFARYSRRRFFHMSRYLPASEFPAEKLENGGKGGDGYMFVEEYTDPALQE